MNRALRFNGSVKSAISAALHDLAGKRLGVPGIQAVGARPGASAAVELHDRHRGERRRTARAHSAGERPIRCSRSSSARDRDEHIIRTRARGGAGQDSARRRQRGVDAEASAANDRRARRVRRGVRRAAACPRTISTGCASFASARAFRSSPTSRASWRPTSRGSSAWWTASTSSSRSAAGCAKR